MRTCLYTEYIQGNEINAYPFTSTFSLPHIRLAGILQVASYTSYQPSLSMPENEQFPLYYIIITHVQNDNSLSENTTTVLYRTMVSL